jgi:hypothetical protein
MSVPDAQAVGVATDWASVTQTGGGVMRAHVYALPVNTNFSATARSYTAECALPGVFQGLAAAVVGVYPNS